MGAWKTSRLVVGVSAFAVPVTVTFLDLFGYVAKVEGASMQPCLNPARQQQADYVFLNRWQVRDFDIRRGEIVSLSAPSKPDQKIIKRVIGLEGDTVKTLSYKNRYVKIPEGHCWVEGDHHGQSMDSNFFGPVALGLITAKASLVVWPPRRWQRLSTWSPRDRVNVARKELPEHLMTFMEDIEKTEDKS